MIHIYCGDGKGKTTCAFGLALRAAGRGRKVVIAQFLKSGDSGERDAIAHVPGVTLLPAPEQVKFTFLMNEEEKAACAVQLKRTLEQVAAQVKAGECGLAVLDECCGALSTGMLTEEEVLAFLDRCPPEAEVVLTGREPPRALLERAGYVTEMVKRKHPYDRGVQARIGVEW